MADFTLRPARADDAAQITSIWRRCFGDSEEFIAELLHGCGLLQNAIGAEIDGALRSCMFAFDGLTVGSHSASYLYALCTQPEYRSRGLGSAVTLRAARCAGQRGAEYVFLCPGDEALERWYAEALGAVAVVRSRFKRLPVTDAEFEKARPLTPVEYLHRRENTPWFLPLSMLLAQDAVHRHYGGAFLDCGGTCVCAEKRGDSVLIRESLPSHSLESAAVAAGYFGVRSAELLVENDGGLPLMLLPLHGENSCLEIPPLPFTLD